MTKIFVAGFFGYAVLGSLVTLGAAAVFPDYLKRHLDMDIPNFLSMMFVYFGLFGLIVTPFMLVGAWVVLRAFRRRDSI